MVVTGYYIQRLSDGKILAGGGVQGGGFNPNDWVNLTGGQLVTDAYWEVVDLKLPYSAYSGQLEKLVENFPKANGNWQHDLFRFLPIQTTL